MNVLEEYLVKIGAEVDRNAFNGANQAIVQLTNALKSLTTAFKVGALLAAFAKLTESIVSNIKAVADLDMQYQKLANQMWVTKDTAKSLKIAMETMGASEQDIAWIPELREQFFRLREEMNALATPVDADNQLRWIREIGYDIQSLQVKLKMLREWIVYYLIKYLKPYIEDFRNFIKWLNQQLGDNMPKVAKKIASVLSSIMSVALSVFRLFKNTFMAIYNFVDRLPVEVKKLSVVFAAVGAMIMMSPFGLMLTALGAAMLLLEDFFYFIDGKKSSRTMAPIWKALTGFANGKGSTFMNVIKRSIQDCIDMLVEFYNTTGKEMVNLFVSGSQQLYENLKNIVEGIGLMETLESWTEGFKTLYRGILAVFSALVRLFKKVDGVGNGTFNKFFKMLGTALGFAIRQWTRFMGLMGNVMSALAAAISGNFKGAAQILGSAIKDFLLGSFKDGKKSGSGILDLGMGLFGGSGSSPYGSNVNGADKAAALVAAQPQELLGNANGCTKFVQTALGSDDAFMQEMAGNLWVPDWLAMAKKNKRFTFGTEGMQKGDIIVVDYGSGTGDHVIMYDGEGGYYGNSSTKINSMGTRGKPVHGSLSDFQGQILGYIRTGNMGGEHGGGGGSYGDAAGDYGGGGGSYGFSVNPNSYAAQTPAGVPAPSLAVPAATGNTYTNSSQSYGNIIINVNGAKDAKAVAEEIRNVMQNPSAYLKANAAQTGGIQ